MSMNLLESNLSQITLENNEEDDGPVQNVETNLPVNVSIIENEHNITEGNEAVEKIKEEEEQEEEEEIKEPTYFCLICADEIPVLSSNHKRECFNSPENYACPFCSRRRRHYLIEDHIVSCAQRRGKSQFEREKAVLFYRTSSEVLERMMLEHRDYILNGFKRSLHMRSELPLFPCIACDTAEEHHKGFCLHKIGGGEFRWRAQNAFDNKFLPHFESYLNVLKEERQHLTLETYARKWEKKDPTKLYDDELRQRVLHRAAQKCNSENEELKAEKLSEVQKMINRHATILGDKMTTYRNYFVIHFL